MPAHQCPTGVAMSTARRQALLQWAARHKSWVFEDDDQSEFRYFDHPVPALYAMSKEQLVLHAGSFDKTLFPALCIGYLVVPPLLVDVFTRAHALLGGHPTILLQVVLADFIESGHFVRHIRRMSECYRERRTALVDVLKEQFGSMVDIAPQPCGLALAVRWKDGRDGGTVAEVAQAHNLHIPSISSFQIRRSAFSGGVFGFAAYDVFAIRNGVERLAAALRGIERPGTIGLPGGREVRAAPGQERKGILAAGRF